METYMKKLIAMIVLTAFTLPLFADDALVLPPGILRTTLLYAFNSFDSAYDIDGDKSDTNQVNMHMMGAALELGIVEGVNVAVQWTPGLTFASSYDLIGYEDADFNGLFDLFIGSKIQILGDDGFVKNEKMRLALALGAVIPLNSYDGAEELSNQAAVDDFTLRSTSNEAFGIGARFYYDFVFSPDFYLNFYTQFIKYFENDKESFGGVSTTYNYGYSLDFELEPCYTINFNEANKLSISVPVQLALTPEREENGVEIADSNTMLLSVAPAVSFFTTAIKLPLEFKAQYAIPVYGVNESAYRTFSFLAKFYAPIF